MKSLTEIVWGCAAVPAAIIAGWGEKFCYQAAQMLEGYSKQTSDIGVYYDALRGYAFSGMLVGITTVLTIGAMKALVESEREERK